MPPLFEFKNPTEKINLLLSCDLCIIIGLPMKPPLKKPWRFVLASVKIALVCCMVRFINNTNKAN